jgi:hypothetical protein
MNARQTALLAALVLLVSACASVWGFADFETADASAGGDDLDATMTDMADAVTPPGASDAGDEVPPCPGGEILCDGGCTDPTTDTKNCNGCGNFCGDGGNNWLCANSTCVCAVGTHYCPLLGCSEDREIASCGPDACTPCLRPLGGIVNCTNGQCVQTCFQNNMLCNPNSPNATCIDPTSDPNNCGTCGTVCQVDGGSSFCDAGACQLTGCTAPLTACPAANPTACVNLSSDRNNCSTCGKKCPAHDSDTESTCVASVCQ